MKGGNDMNDLYFEELKLRIIKSAMWTNLNAEDKDINRNHVNYGCTTSYSRILDDFGNKVEVPVWEDENKCLRIPFIKINENKIIEFE